MSTSQSPILVINNGSSSLKLSVFDPKSETVLSFGLGERIGTEQGVLKLSDLENGTSHHYVTLEAARRLGKPYDQLQFISAHLGNGCSATAVKNGRSVDTTMGLTPVIFTGGIGENNAFIRDKVLAHLAVLHPEIDPKLNEQNGKHSNGRITSGSGLLCFVIPTNEELMIARETDRLVPNPGSSGLKWAPRIKMHLKLLNPLNPLARPL